MYQVQKLITWWHAYKNYIKGVILPGYDARFKDISYLRDELFCDILTYVLPVSMIALIPSIYVSFNEIPAITVCDLLVFGALVVLAAKRNISLPVRKLVFIISSFFLSVVLLYYVSEVGSGMLYLLAITVIISAIYSSRAAYLSILANIIVCIGFGFLIYFKVDTPIATQYTVVTWIAVSSNLITLSIICAVCLNILIDGLEKNVRDKNIAEKELTVINERLLFHIKSAPLGFIEWDKDLHIKLWSKQAEEIFGWTSAEIIALQKTGYDLVYNEDIELATKTAEELLSGTAGSNSIQHRNNTKSGKVIWCEWFNSTLKDKDGKVVTVISLVNDITEQKHQQQKLSQSEANLAAIIENTDAHIYSLDKKFRYITFNRTLKARMKATYNVDIKPGDGVFDFLTKSDPAAAAEWTSIYTEALLGKSLRFEKEYNVGNYRSFTDFSINPIIENENIIGLSCFAIDITERKENEEKIKALNASLEHKVKERTTKAVVANKELEAFSYTVSHDLQAPLRTTSGFIAILLRDYMGKLDETAGRFLQIISDNSNRMSRMVLDLLAFSKLGNAELRKREVDMNELVLVVIAEVEGSSCKGSLEIILKDTPNALCDLHLIRQVWANLISNAIKSSGKKENPVVEIGADIVNEEVVYYVKDNGAGFDMKYADQLFGEFKCLHGASEFEGTGVGLSTVRRIINRHGGRIWANAKVDEGATFYFTLKA